jgi:hypothetical protein
VRVKRGAIMHHDFVDLLANRSKSSRISKRGVPPGSLKTGSPEERIRSNAASLSSSQQPGRILFLLPADSRIDPITREA